MYQAAISGHSVTIRAATASSRAWASVVGVVDVRELSVHVLSGRRIVGDDCGLVCLEALDDRDYPGVPDIVGPEFARQPQAAMTLPATSTWRSKKELCAARASRPLMAVVTPFVTVHQAPVEGALVGEFGLRSDRILVGHCVLGAGYSLLAPHT